LPGLGMDCLGFLRQLPLGALADLHLVQTANQPVKDAQGFGHFAPAVEAYIKSRQLEQRPGGVVLGGCSMGGALTLAVAVRGNVQLRGLVLLSTFGSSRHLPRWQRALAPLAWALPWRLGRMAA